MRREAGKRKAEEMRKDKKKEGRDAEDVDQER
jgi:hypothetical protein